MNRRSFLTTMGFLPFTMAIEKLAWPLHPTGMPANMQSNELHVYFHGLFAFFPDSGSKLVNIYPPIVDLRNHKHKHDYRAGEVGDICDPDEKCLNAGKRYDLSLTKYTPGAVPSRTD